MKEEEAVEFENELWDLAINSPAKHYWIYITDEKRGIGFKVDQSLDSHITGNNHSMKELIDMMIGAREYFKLHTYEETFKDKPLDELNIDGFSIKFDGVGGKEAFTLLMRYFNNLLTQLESQGLIKKNTNIGDVKYGK